MKYLYATLLLFFFSALTATDNFVVITPEKAGTHLLTRALTFLTGQKVINVWDRSRSSKDIENYLHNAANEGKYFHMHAFPEPHILKIFQEGGYKVIFLLRDPRDQLISILFYIRERHWEYKQLRMDFPFGNLSFEDQIEEMITGEKYGVQVPYDFFKYRTSWMSFGNVYTAYFENLVGERGKGSKAAQINELSGLSDFLHIQVSNEQLQDIADNLFGWHGLGTFRSGQIGSWKDYFSERHINLFNQYFGNDLIEFGYTP